MEIKDLKNCKFDTLFIQHYERLVLFAESYVVASQLAEDIVQDVFLSLYSRPDFENVEYTRSYLFSCVRNSCVDYLRELKVKDRHNLLLFDAAFYTADFDLLEEDALIGRVAEAIDRLPEQRREILKYSVYQGMSYTEIAEVTGLSVNTVKTHMKKAYQDLREQLYHLKYDLILLYIYSKLDQSGM